ncbi:MAG TPA: hypothetical protein VHJ82_00470 [Actinomycetota bacterium]|nr:hypothetical protein [Actinomycetota bacterium]
MRGLFRALVGRCPLCGSKGIWRSFGQTVDRCPRCNYLYDREEGYWVGGLIVNIAFAMALFFLLFVGGMLVTWPEVPWTTLLIVNLVALGLGPVLFYPLSKTIWVWLDVTFLHPLDRPSERTPNTR